MNHRPIVLVLLLTAACAAQDEKDAEEKIYTIRLFRPAKVGDRYRLSSSRSIEQRRITFDGARETSRAESALRGALTGTVTVRRVDERGRLRALTCVVESFSLTADGIETHPIEKGVVLLSDEVADETTIKRDDGRPVPAAALDLLVLMLEVTNTSDEDAMFGSAVPRAPGETWAGHTAAIAADLKDNQLAAAHEDIRAELKVTAVTKLAGREVVEVARNVSAKVSDERAQAATLEKGTLEFRGTTVGDADPARRVPAVQSGTLTVAFHGKGAFARFETSFMVESRDELTSIDG
jgi:hypothetical protein